MSLNAALNATVALIEGRTDIAKEILRSPVSDVKNVPEIMARLDRAVNVAAARALRNALVRTLAVQPDSKKMSKEVSKEEAFYLGVKAVEDVLDQVVYELQKDAHLNPEDD